jgi:hypothetical protein
VTGPPPESSTVPPTSELPIGSPVTASGTMIPGNSRMAPFGPPSQQPHLVRKTVSVDSSTARPNTGDIGIVSTSAPVFVSKALTGSALPGLAT